VKSPIQVAIDRLVKGNSLSREDSSRVMQIVLNGGASPAQIAAVMVAMRMKGETPEELAGAAETLLAKASPFSAPDGAADNCGTGGDDAKMLNVSTAAAFIAAACGIPVAKHGNRAVSSRCGSADVLEALGVNIEAPRAVQERALHEANVCFLMAPLYHPAMREVAPVRKEIGVRSLFNLLGPLLNPAHVKYRLLGTFDRAWLVPMAETLKRLGCRRAWAVHSEDGTDEISIFAPTYVASLEEDGTIREFTIRPEELPIPGDLPPESLRGGDPSYNARAMQLMLLGQGPEAFECAAALNAAALAVVTGKHATLRAAFEEARDSVRSGAALDALHRMREMTCASEDG
jgi:anthranilate phosphoribosyltransferase